MNNWTVTARKNHNRVADRLKPGNFYTRVDLDEIYFSEFNSNVFRRSREGLVHFLDFNVALFCTLDKSNKPVDFSYNDFFEGDLFHWDSQNRQHINTPIIQQMILGRWQTLLFCRVVDKIRSRTQPFVYCGRLIYEKHDKATSNPVHIMFKCLDYQLNPNRSLERLYLWTPTEKSNHSGRVTEKEIERRSIVSGRYQNDVKKRKLVETHAMNVAIAHYRELGFKVSDVSSTHSYDLICDSEDHGRRLVEVKGLQGVPATVQLTANEVVSARNDQTQTDLFVVHNIEFLNDDEVNKNSGRIVKIEDWIPEEIDLSPTQYTYRLPPT